MTVVARDLSTVDVSIADQQYTGSKVTINPRACLKNILNCLF